MSKSGMSKSGMSRLFVACKGKTACQENEMECRTCGRSLDEVYGTRALVVSWQTLHRKWVMKIAIPSWNMLLIKPPKKFTTCSRRRITRTPLTMTIISWDENNFLLNVKIMDDTHKEFVTLLNHLADSADSQFASRFDALISHTRLHFQQEEKLMSESLFPAYAEHRDEHQRILGELNQFKKRVDKGLVVFGRNYINERMPEWFNLHAATMDSALAGHLKSGSPGKTGS